MAGQPRPSYPDASDEQSHFKGRYDIPESQDVMATGDSVVITLDQATKRPKTAKIRTAIDGLPVALDVTFGTVEYGPNYPSRSITTSE